MMGTLNFEDKSYTFNWTKIAILFLGAPLLALIMYFSHPWFWLHGITSKFTIWLLNLIYPGSFESNFNPNALINFGAYLSMLLNPQKDLVLGTPWSIIVYGESGQRIGIIGFETLCTGVHAMAIFIGVILFSPHPLENKTKKDIWKRKGLAILTTSVIFYFVNILRMIIQLSLYRNGANWDDVHYPISAASSFIAVACVLLVHKYVPEFIMGLIWIGDEIREMLAKPEEDLDVSEISEEPTDANESLQEEEIFHPEKPMPKDSDLN